MIREQIAERAKAILLETDTYRLPVPVDVVANRLGLRVEAAPLGKNVSGLLVLIDELGVIGYNSNHPQVRQRFTIAHEIGHFILHQGQDSLFIDEKYGAVYHRNVESSGGEDFREIQANGFAAALLMPKDLVSAELSKSGFDLGDESALVELARKFKVSSQAMAFRLANLDLIGLPDLT